MPQRICCGISCLYGCLLSSDCQFDSLRMLLRKRLHIINHQHEIATATSSRHLPGMNLRKYGILINIRLYAALNHGWEQGYLGIEGCLEGRCKGCKIHCEDSIPAIIGSLGKILHLWLGMSLPSTTEQPGRRGSIGIMQTWLSTHERTFSSRQVSNLSGQKRLS